MAVGKAQQSAYGALQAALTATSDTTGGKPVDAYTAGLLNATTPQLQAELAEQNRQVDLANAASSHEQLAVLGLSFLALAGVLTGLAAVVRESRGGSDLPFGGVRHGGCRRAAGDPGVRLGDGAARARPAEPDYGCPASDQRPASATRGSRRTPGAQWRNETASSLSVGSAWLSSSGRSRSRSARNNAARSCEKPFLTTMRRTARSSRFAGNV